jgi:hypothetical protein
MAAPVAEACSCICPDDSRARNGIERREQVRQTILKHDYLFIGEVIAIGEALPLPENASPFADPLHAITIRPLKIVKGPRTETITVLARLGSGSNCLNELSIGSHFRGLAKREGDAWVAFNSNCDCYNWAIFDDDGPLADAQYRRTTTAGACPS